MSIATISAAARLADDGYSIEAVFIPWTSSRGYAPEKKVTQRSLNWNVTLKRHGKPIVTALYSAGIAHCPSYPKSPSYRGFSVDDAKAIEYETQSGYRFGATREKILPDLYSVVAALLSDADVSNYPDFESWAADMGFDADSRSAERSYRECRRIAEHFTARVGLEEMARLRRLIGEW